MVRPILLTALVALAAGSASAQAGPRAAWRVVFDTRPAPDTAAPFVTMAPGWHAVAGSGMLAFDSTNSWRGDDSLESVLYLFSPTPGTGAGIMLGGRDLGTPTEHYVAFVVGPDGRYQIVRRSRGATTALIPWRVAAAAPKHPGGSGNVRVVLGVRADSVNLTFTINGSVVATLPKIAVEPAGTVGLRFERGTSAHIATLSIGDRNVAPTPARTS
jgi:hypothetical protein